MQKDVDQYLETLHADQLRELLSLERQARQSLEADLARLYDLGRTSERREAEILEELDQLRVQLLETQEALSNAWKARDQMRDRLRHVVKNSNRLLGQHREQTRAMKAVRSLLSVSIRNARLCKDLNAQEDGGEEEE